jgi:tRNA threonylcarbamoyladenosine biosynthesis protein TsaB
MRVLAIDTALEACSAAVLDTERGDVLASESLAMVRGHAEALMPLVAQVMALAGLRFADLDRVAVTVGPGSFTGLRVGIAAARGIGLGAAKPVVGLTTLAALAAPYIAADEATPIAAAVDARHGHVYFQLYGIGGRTLIPARVVPAREAAHAAASASARLVGSGAGFIAQNWMEDIPPPLIDERRAPDIDWVARLGAAAEPKQSLPKPLYLRAPDVQPQATAHLPRR